MAFPDARDLEAGLTGPPVPRQQIFRIAPWSSVSHHLEVYVISFTWKHPEIRALQRAASLTRRTWCQNSNPEAESQHNSASDRNVLVTFCIISRMIAKQMLNLLSC
jgi:hypothetical protein